MTDFEKKLYLRAANEQELIDALGFARGVNLNDEPMWIEATNDYALDIIGELYNDDAVIVAG